MSRVWWFFMLSLIVINSIPVSSAPSLAISSWPPKLPTIPSLKDLNIAIRGIMSNPSSETDMDLLETKTSENTDEHACKDCEHEIIELEAEELDPDQLTALDINAKDEKSKNIFIIDDITFENELNKLPEISTENLQTKEEDLSRPSLNNKVDVIKTKETVLNQDTVNENYNGTKINSDEVKSDINQTEYTGTTVTQHIKNTSSLTTNKFAKDSKITSIATKENFGKKPSTFVPIFRPKKQSRPNKIDILTQKTYSPIKQDDANFSALRNSIENNDLIVQYVKNIDSKPIVNIFGPHDLTENSNIRIIPFNSMHPDGVTVNSFPSNAFDLASNGQNIVPSNEVPNTVNVVSANKVENPANSVTTYRVSAEFPVNAFPTGHIPVPRPVLENPAHLNRHPTTLYPSNTFPVNAASSNVIPNGKFPTTNYATNSIPVNPLSAAPGSSIPLNKAPTSTTFPVTTVPQNYLPNLPANQHPPGYLQPNAVASVPPTISVPSNNLPVSSSCPCPSSSGYPLPFASASVNTIPNIPAASLYRPPACNLQNISPPTSSCPSSVASLNSVIPNTNPVSIPTGINSGCNVYPNIGPVSRSSGCNMAPNTPIMSSVSHCNQCQKCPDGPNKADLVLFKPKNITVETVMGDILKRTTMTVLEPVYVTKLDV